MTTYTLTGANGVNAALPVSDALAARLAALLEATPAEEIEAAAAKFADALEEAAADAWINEPLDQETLDLLKERADEVKAGARLYTLDEMLVAASAAAKRGAERRRREQEGSTA